MKARVLAVVLGVAASGVIAAHAQTVIEERNVTVPPPSSSVTVEHRDGVAGTEKKSITVETNGTGDCTTKTVHKENLEGSKTVKKTNCD